MILCCKYNQKKQQILKKIKKNRHSIFDSKCFTNPSNSLPVQYLLLVVDAWTVGGGGGGVLGDGG